MPKETITVKGVSHMEKCFRYFLRILIYAIGLFFLAIGVVLAINSDLGVSPVNSLPYVLSLISGIDMGACVTMVFSVYILVQILIKRRDFQWINLTQLIFSALFGYFVDFARQMVGSFSFPTYAGQLVTLLISMVFVAIGLSLYMGVDLVNMPMEGMTLAISECFPQYSFHKIKIVVDCSSVLIGILLSFLFLGRLQGIREGTVLSALFIGKLLSLLQKPIQLVVRRLCFGERNYVYDGS